MRRIGLYSIEPRGVNATGQNICIGDCRLLPRHFGDAASRQSLSSCAIDLLDLCLNAFGCLVDVIEVEVADRMPLITIPLAARLAGDLRDIIFIGKPRRFLLRSTLARRGGYPDSA